MGGWGGADKASAPAESIDAAAPHLSPGGGWRDGARKESREREKHGLRGRDSGNSCWVGGFLFFFFLAASDGAFIVARLCKRGERALLPAHIIFSLSRNIHKHLHKQ